MKIIVPPVGAIPKAPEIAVIVPAQFCPVLRLKAIFSMTFLAIAIVIVPGMFLAIAIVIVPGMFLPVAVTVVAITILRR